MLYRKRRYIRVHALASAIVVLGLIPYLLLLTYMHLMIRQDHMGSMSRAAAFCQDLILLSILGYWKCILLNRCQNRRGSLADADVYTLTYTCKSVQYNVQ